MACGCHGKNKEYVGNGVQPDDQCTACASKHINIARELWGEFQYEETNRRKVAGQLRLAVEHLKYDHTELALHCRDTAMIIEESRDINKRDVRDCIQHLLDDALILFYKDNPEAKGRFEKLTNLPQ